MTYVSTHRRGSGIADSFAFIFSYTSVSCELEKAEKQSKTN